MLDIDEFYQEGQSSERVEELFGTDSIPFEEPDVFNDCQVIKGFLCRRSTDLYGALYITHVRGDFCPQLIYGTPKMHYPFDKQGKYTFPDANKVECYEKLDGTNILAFTYNDGHDYFQSFKTRLTPTVRGGSFGDFNSMWREMIAKYPFINEVSFANGCSVSFELYGARNKHLLWYDVPLEVAVLFGVRGDGTIIPPTSLRLQGLPIAKLLTTFDSDLVETYKQQKVLLQENIVEKEDGYEGMEGSVWYLTSGMNVIQFKCKPETIELIHFASGGIGRNVIRATAYNVFEQTDELTNEAVIELLKEEFTARQIEKALPRIQKVVIEVGVEMTLRKIVVEDYRNLVCFTGYDIRKEEDKSPIMRWYSKRYFKSDMRKVYTILKGLH